MKADNYVLIDSGQGRKLERFGDYVLSRPCAQAVWKQTALKSEWHSADAVFTREEENRWEKKKNTPDSWQCCVEDIQFHIRPTDFGHLGIFPEQKPLWCWIRDMCRASAAKRGSPLKVLNLFAYSGGATLAAAQGGAQVCHLDASKGMVAWARENAALNGLEGAPIRWIIDDVMKFLQREERRGSLYDAIILDPPTFGRGAKGELFKIEETIIPLLECCQRLLSKNPAFVLLSCHTPGFTPETIHNLLIQIFGSSSAIECAEMLLSSPNTFSVPSGVYGRWVA